MKRHPSQPAREPAKPTKIIAIENMLLRHWKTLDCTPAGMTREVCIEIWPDVAKYGLRVAEVTLVTKPSNGSLPGTSGSSFMQCEPDGLKVCALVERLAIEPELEDIDSLTETLYAAVFA